MRSVSSSRATSVLDFGWYSAAYISVILFFVHCVFRSLSSSPAVCNNETTVVPQHNDQLLKDSCRTLILLTVEHGIIYA